MQITKLIITILIAASFLIPNSLQAWNETRTHPDLSEIAARKSILVTQDYLKKSLGLAKGIDEIVSGKPVFEWMRDGALYEDDGSDLDALLGRARYVNHFHDPTKLWDNAGLSDMQNGQSSIRWAQNSAGQENAIGGNWSWQALREFYYIALTGKAFDGHVMAFTEEVRNNFLAWTFSGLGHQMHLIQDAAQPAHVRNDAHPIDGKGWTDGLETWARKNVPFIEAFASTPLSPQVALDINNNDSLAPSPITQFVDTRQYIASLIPDTSLAWGISEYTNSNFVSDDTIFTENFGVDMHSFPYPRYSTQCYDLYDENNSANKKTTYLKRKSDNGCGGESINHFAVAGPLFKYLGFDWGLQRLTLKLDSAVHHDYAQKLIPRAVGYSAGLLNYFFRGDIDLIDEGSGYVIVNNTEEDMDGTFELYYDNADDERTILLSNNFTIGTFSSGNNKSGNININRPVDAVRYFLVFRGRLGNEYDAVVGKLIEMKDQFLYLVGVDASIIPMFKIKTVESGYELVLAEGINMQANIYTSSEGSLLALSSPDQKRHEIFTAINWEHPLNRYGVDTGAFLTIVPFADTYQIFNHSSSAWANGRRNYTLDVNGNSVSWQEQVRLGSASGHYNLKYTDTGGEIFINDIAVDINLPPNTPGESIENNVVAALGDKKILNVKTAENSIGEERFCWLNVLDNSIFQDITFRRERNRIDGSVKLFFGDILVKEVIPYSTTWWGPWPQFGPGRVGPNCDEIDWYSEYIGQCPGSNGHYSTPVREDKQINVLDYDNYNGNSVFVLFYEIFESSYHPSPVESHTYYLSYNVNNEIKSEIEIGRILSDGSYDFCGSNSEVYISGSRISNVSSQINDKFIVYTYNIENYSNETWVFNKRIIGIINISDNALPIGYRQEFEFNFIGTDFNLSQPAAIGVTR